MESVPALFRFGKYKFNSVKQSGCVLDYSSTLHAGNRTPSASLEEVDGRGISIGRYTVVCLLLHVVVCGRGDTRSRVCYRERE